VDNKRYYSLALWKLHRASCHDL